MKEIINDIVVLDDNLFISWISIIPSYFDLFIWDLFDIEHDIFFGMGNIIGNRK